MADRAGLTVVLAGSLAVQVLLLGVAAGALVLGIFPPSGAGALVIQVALAAWFGVALWRVRRA